VNIVVAESSWQTIVDELDRVAPAEGVLLPLVALEHAKPPCAPIELADVTSVALAEVRVVPPHLQVNSGAHVAALASCDAWADDVVLPLVRRHPRLRAAAYLHSHPFATEHTWPSGTDVSGHMLPLLRRMVDTGLHASFSFIACRSYDGGWRLPCFAIDRRERVIELGNATVVPDTAATIQRARCERAQRWLVRRWKRQLVRRGLAVRTDELFDGWLRVQVKLGAERTLVVLFPVDFPAAPPRYHLVDLRTRRARQVELAFRVDGGEVLAA
jgi:hypothetical protein